MHLQHGAQGPAQVALAVSGGHPCPDWESHSPFPALCRMLGGISTPLSRAWRCHPCLRGCGCQCWACFKGQQVPILPPTAFFISFWSGIRHLLTEQTLCCPENPPLRSGAVSPLCQCPEPARLGLGLGHLSMGKAEPFWVTFCTGAGAWLQHSALLPCFNLFLLQCPSHETRDATKEWLRWGFGVCQQPKVCRELHGSQHQSQLCSPQARLWEWWCGGW